MPKAKNLKYLRLKAGLTQQQLSDKTGFAKSTINAWETKRRSIPTERTKELAHFFGMTFEDFCDSDAEALDKEYGRIELTPVEAENIFIFRTLPDEVKDNIRREIKLWQKFIEKGSS